MARPVVASKIGGIPEMIIDGVNGFLTAPENHEALAEAICKLLGDPELRYQFGSAGKRISDEKFSQNAHIKKIMDIYEGLGIE